MSIKTMICALTVGLTLSGTCAHASPMLERTNGNITGVTGLLIDGDVWNATFNAGSFVSINATTPLLQTNSFAQAAAAALYDFIATIPLSDYGPADFVGCTDNSHCFLATPYSYNTFGFVFASYVEVFESDPPYAPGPGNGVSYFGAQEVADVTNVSWVPTAVPEPPLIFLMASGLIVLSVTRRKRRA